MHIQDLILLVIDEEKEHSLRGWTLLQKKLYFLSVLKGDDLDFRPHYYGPYSSLVASGLDTLVGVGFLNELIETFPAKENTNVFGEVRCHAYFLNDRGKTVMHDIEKEDDYKTWKREINRLNRQPLAGDSNKLSIAAKVHYITRCAKENVTPEQIRDAAKQYNCEIMNLDVDGVIKFLEKLSLVSA